MSEHDAVVRVPSRPLTFTDDVVWRDWGDDADGAENERLVAQLVSGVAPPVAPAPVESTTHSRVGWQRIASVRPAGVDDLGALLARLHALTPPPQAGELLQRSGGLAQAARAIARCATARPTPKALVYSSTRTHSHERDVLRRAYDRLADAPEAASADAGLIVVHGDATVENVVVGADGPLLIDWEESGWGPAWADLAPLMARSVYYGAPAGSVRQLFAAYEAAGGVLDAPVDDPVWFWRAATYGLYATANSCERRRRGGDPREAARRLAYWANGSLQRWTVQ